MSSKTVAMYSLRLGDSGVEVDPLACLVLSRIAEHDPVAMLIDDIVRIGRA